MNQTFYKWDNSDLMLAIRTVPRASRDRLGDIVNDRLKVYITAPPVDGKANQTLCKFISKQFKVPASKIKILKGETSRDKKLLIPAPTKTPDMIKPATTHA